MIQRQSNNQWSGGIDSPRPKIFLVQKSAGKALASFFWDQDGILLIDYLPKCQTINTEYYSSLLVQLKDILTHCRPIGLLIKYLQFPDVLNALNVQPHNILLLTV